MPTHALVLGGSIGGLLATRVLSDSFDQVTIFDRDVFPSTPENRRGVPQGRHTHGLLAGGREVLEEFFPGISKELVSAGAVCGDMLANSRWYIEQGAHVRFVSGLEGILLSRPFLEFEIRRRVLALPNVSCRTGAIAEGLVYDGVTGRVNGARVSGETITGDLTLDATGCASHSPQWLEEIGFPKPHEDQIGIDMAYSTCLFRRRRTDLDGDLALIYGTSPETGRSGAMLAQEGDRWIVTQARHNGRKLPADVPSFIEYSRGLPTLDMYGVISKAEPLCEPFQARFPANLRRRYESVVRFPVNYLVFGDAISSFNPVYAQGMSVACMQARALKQTLTESRENPAARFFQRAAKVIDSSWDIAVGADLRIPTTTGPRTKKTSVLNWYVARLHRAAHKDPVAALAFHRVANLLEPPPSLMRPGIAVRVLCGGFARSRSVRLDCAAQTASQGRS
jgi:2-polyprenyl-6-methoxyphenol hydroxylase-like FAD-dependent oxidoreductase